MHPLQPWTTSLHMSHPFSVLAVQLLDGLVGGSATLPLDKRQLSCYVYIGDHPKPAVWVVYHIFALLLDGRVSKQRRGGYNVLGHLPPPPTAPQLAAGPPQPWVAPLHALQSPTARVRQCTYPSRGASPPDPKQMMHMPYGIYAEYS